MSEKRFRSLAESELALSPRDEFTSDVLLGLSQSPKTLASKYFYDDEGSRLFSQITELDDYYLTNCEYEIFEKRGAELTKHFGKEPYDLVELGAGDGRKTVVLLSHLKNASLRYVPIDISVGAMRSLVERVEKQFPALAIDGIVSEYLQGLNALKQTGRRKVVLFLGSNIGNFPNGSAAIFLQRLWSALNDGDMVLVGFDLKKDPEILHRAYSDSKGVTAEFNYNLLDRINRELGANFDRKKFRHYAAYNFRAGAMESFLVSLERQSVRIEALRRTFEFYAWEPIHTEYSVKYTESSIERMATVAGFEVIANVRDGRDYFCDSLWRALK